MISVDEIMTSNPKTLLDNNTVQDAKNLMAEMHFRHIPIVDSEGKLVGLVSQRDVLAASASEHLDIRKSSRGDSEIQLQEIMTKIVASVSPKDNLRRAAIILQSNKMGCLPVLDNDELVGIITDSDYITVAINLLEQWEQQEEEIAGIDDEFAEEVYELEGIE